MMITIVGANGNVTNLALPGGLLVGFTGLGTLHANKDQLQRKGIQPHILVEPTIDDLTKGIDTIFESAVQYLKTETNRNPNKK